MKKKFLLTSVLTIALCFCLIAGSTFALFSSEKKVNIVATAGEVDVTAALTDPVLESVEPVANGTTVTSEMVQDEHGKYYLYQTQQDTFYNGGTATVENGTLTLARITPGDRVTFYIDIENGSNVAIAHRFNITCLSGYTLMYGLVVTINDTPYTSLESYTSAWNTLTANASINDIEISIELPVDAGNVYQKQSATVQVTVEAVQSNANVTGAETVTYIEKPADAIELQNAILAGGEITGVGATVENDGLALDGEDVMLSDIKLVQTAPASGYSLGLENGETLTLDQGAIVETTYGYGVVVNTTGTLVMNAGSKITCTNEDAACIMVMCGINEEIDIYLNDVDLLDAQNGAKGIWVLGSTGTINIHVKDAAAKAHYEALLATDPGTAAANINWVVAE